MDWHTWSAADWQRRVEAGARDVLLELERKALCVPAICRAPPELYASSNDNTTKLPRLYLASYPGSGNTWLRTVVRAGTRHFTGSMFVDRDLINAGFVGEALPPDSPQTKLVKSHYPTYGKRREHPRKWADGALHIARAPFDAISAECQRLASLSHNEVAPQARVEERCAHAQTHRRIFDLWTETMAAWNPGSRSPAPPSASLIRMELLQFPGRAAPFPVATMFYEDFVRDFDAAVAHMFAYLKIWLGDDGMPSVADAVLCALLEAHEQERFHRSSKGRLNFFRTSVLQDAAQLRESVAAMCRIFEPFWDLARWGKCDGTTQAERARVASKKRLAVHNLESCH